jgi:hypothetical protein
MNQRVIITTRRRLEAKIEELISLLDLVDGDPDLEDENEHGGDIQDEPHDDEGEIEDSLGWPNPCGPGDAPMHDWSPTDELGTNQFNVSDAKFDGSGYHVGRVMLAKAPKSRGGF